MPAEERKFRRRSIVAFLPTCNREREIAASHISTSVSDGISTIGVRVDGTTGVSVGKGRGVKVGVGKFVPVGDGIRTTVAVCRLEVAVPVGDAIGSAVAVSPIEVEVSVDDGITSAVDVNAPEAEVCVGDGNGGAEGAVIVDALGVNVPVGDGIGAATVVVTELVSVGEIGVSIGVRILACRAFAGNHIIKQINISRSMSATINLNRS